MPLCTKRNELFFALKSCKTALIPWFFQVITFGAYAHSETVFYFPGVWIL